MYEQKAEGFISDSEEKRYLMGEKDGRPYIERRPNQHTRTRLVSNFHLIAVNSHALGSQSP